ncbi:hypothetical protein BC834DRAFT_967265 [Gloeopeniophorella convolvens]|nr:hypothetical protein BC834DRAFT_967265 [Gloeopeniophorella convolvens]
MVNWQNPVTLVNELGAVVKLIHVADGIYIWEFICNLGFEWGLVTGRRQWRWTAALYIGCRVATIAQVFADLIGLNATGRINCRLWLIFVLVFAYASATLSLSLYALRSIAVWQRAMPAVALCAALVLTNVGVWIRRIIQARSEWSVLTQTCTWSGTHDALLNSATLLGTELALLGLIAGGMYARNPGGRVLRMMYREGLAWLGAAVIGQALPVVFLILNLNDAMNIMFIIPSIICTSIGATRMYRLLSDRQAGNILDFWETSRDETTGEIRFRRQTQFVTRTDGASGDTASTTALPMGRLVRTQPAAAAGAAPDARFVERFEARDIELDDADSDTLDAKAVPIAMDDQPWAGPHAK